MAVLTDRQKKERASLSSRFWNGLILNIDSENNSRRTRSSINCNNCKREYRNLLKQDDSQKLNYEKDNLFSR